ncbi:MAG: O-antigen ligase family protein [Gemmataceae bacterium]
MSTEKHSIQIETQDDRLPISRYLRVMGEAVLYFILVISPWVFGGVDPEWQYVIVGATFVLTVLWLLRCVYYRRISIRTDGVTWGIGGLLCLTVLQVVPLPLSVVSIISPQRATQYTELVPETLEQIGDEAPRSRPNWITLSVDPYLTRHFLADLIICLAVYTITRNWLATRGSIQRMSMILAANAFVLALFSLGQFFLSRGKIYGLYPVPNSFGCFVCRNHYPFHAYLGLGLAVGLLFNKTRTEYSSAPSGKGIRESSQGLATWLNTVSQTPVAVLMLAASIVIAVSIPFSLSRGGILTLAIAGVFILLMVAWTIGRKVGTNLILAGIFAMSIFALGAWLGWGPVERRIGAELSNGVVDNRSTLWLSAIRVARMFPMFGCGANAFQRVEPSVRVPEPTGNDTIVINDSVHNEYLEALCEGGVLRLLFTLVLVVSPIASAVQAYRRLQSRSVGTLTLGMAFGLFAVAVHSFFDFGIHIPAIALLVVTVAAFARASSVDPDFQPKRRMKFSGKNEQGVKEIDSDSQIVMLTTRTAVGPPAIAVCVAVLIGMSLLVKQYRSWDRAERYSAAAIALSKSDDPERHDRRIALSRARVGYAPDDPDAHAALSRAYFDALFEPSRSTLIESNGKLEFSEKERVEYLLPGLQAAVNSRTACPYLASSYMRLAVFRDQFNATEPSSVYFDRVKRLAPCDPEAWFAAGNDALKHNRFDAAVADWKQSLKLSIRQMAPILEKASKHPSLSDNPEVILPENPAVILAAVNKLFPDHQASKGNRTRYLKQIEKICAEMPSPRVDDYMALAQVEYELGNVAMSRKAWQMAVAKAPNDARVRIQYARWLEIEEQYDLLISELDWLRTHGQGGSNISDRLDAAHHAIELKTRIERP